MTELDADSLWLDTARYRLAPGMRAFGVLVHSAVSGPSCPDAGFEDELTLLAPDGDKLRPVFDSYLHLWHSLQEGQCPPARSESAELTLDIGPGTSHGYADLVVTAKVEADRSHAGGSDNQSSFRTVRQTVHYDGRSYPLDSIPKFWQAHPQ